MSDILRSLGYIAWPSPVLDERATIDPFTTARVDGDRLLVTLRDSGDEVEARFSEPVRGVLRVRIGEALGDAPTSPMLVDGLTDRPLTIREEDGAAVLEGEEVRARWTLDHSVLSVGRFERAPLVGIITGSMGGAGRLVGAQGHLGWVETFALAPDAAVFGGGESFQGPNLRGRVRRLVNQENHGAAGLDVSYLNVPLVWSDDGWGIFAHSEGPVRADLGAAHAEVGAVAVEGAELDVFIYTGTAPEIIRAHQLVTGDPGGFPDWGFGVWTSRCSYLSEAEIQGIIDGYEEHDCPVDVVHVDAWVEGNVISELVCNWSVDRDRFPEGWGRRLSERGVRLSLWHNPYVLIGSPIAADLEERGFLITDGDGNIVPTNDKPDRAVIDLTDPDAYAWWQDRIRETARTEGNVAFKPDFAEEVPERGILHDGRTGRERRNAYANLYQRATHDALAEVLGTDDVALFCRAGTAGAQRYPCHWVGDSPSTWVGLTSALRACLSLSLSGFGVVGADVGGFYTPEAFPLMQKAFETWDHTHFPVDVDGELFLRWTQWGALSPVMRFHGTGRREPWAYPPPYGTLSVEACRIRERLRGYLVRIAREAATDGTPMMRPMPLAFPGDRGARDADLQYLLGPDILVAPLVEPGGVRTVYAPEGRWRGLWGLDPIEGPGWRRVRCDLDAYPAWVREDAPDPLEA